MILLLGLLGCESPRSVIELPPCATRMEVEGQATRLSTRRFELDHTFDLPFSRTLIQVSRAAPASPTSSAVATREYEIVDSQPDALRFFTGAAAGVVGALLLAGAGYDVLVQGRAIGEAQPFYESVWGAGLVSLGVLGMGTGWHPPRRVFVIPADSCAASPKPATTPEARRGVLER